MPISISISNQIGVQSRIANPSPRESFYIVQQNTAFPNRLALNQDRTEFLTQQNG